MLLPEILALSLLPLFPTVVLGFSNDQATRFGRHFHARDYVKANQRSEGYDFVIAGGGLAGLTLAARLSDDPSVTVLVLEAGSDGSTLVDKINTPGQAYFGNIMGQPGYGWGYETVPQPKAGGRSMSQPRGRVLGGSSAINGLYMVSPTRTQLDAWRDLASDGTSSGQDWGWDTFHSTLKRLEIFTPPTADAVTAAGIKYDTSSHGTSGRLHTSYPGYMVPITGQWLPTLESLGIPSIADAYGGDNIGAFFSTSAINPTNWTRSYSKTAFTDPLPPRTNLHIVSDATVEKIVFAANVVDGDRQASAVQFSSGKGTEVMEVQVKQEVILSGGAMGTPHILLVSGVGPRDVLTAAGVSIQAELPGVGQHLMDHLAAAVYFEAKTDTQGDIHASGSALSQTPEFNSFVNSGIAYINGTYLFDTHQNLETLRALIIDGRDEYAGLLVPSVYPEVVEGYKAIYDTAVSKLYPANGLIEVLLSINAPGRVGVQAALQMPMSQGRVYIDKPSIYDPLLIDPQYFTHDSDLVQLRQGIKVARRIAAAAPLSQSLGAEITPGPDVTTDEQIDAWIVNNAGSEFHPCGTSAMLPKGKGGVVDTKLKVYGLSNVRVVDASVFPISFSAHLMAPTYALAEQAADIIQAEHKHSPDSSSTSVNNGKPTNNKTNAALGLSFNQAILTFFLLPLYLYLLRSLVF